MEWYRFRKDRSPNCRRRRDRLEDVGVRVTRAIGPTSATLIDLFNGRFMGNPSLMEMATRGVTLAEVFVVLATDSRHDRLEAGQLVLQVLQGIMENVYLGVLLTNHFTEVATLTKS